MGTNGGKDVAAHTDVEDVAADADAYSDASGSGRKCGWKWEFKYG